MWRRRTSYSEFQPTLPLRERPHVRTNEILRMRVSTHAPLAGSDGRRVRSAHTCRVSTHAPCGERHPRRVACRTRRARFNPRSPCGERRRTHVDGHAHVLGVSTHAPLAGSDEASHRTPHPFSVSTTPPLRGATCPSRQPPNRPLCFQPLALASERQETRERRHLRPSFQPTLLAGSDARVRHWPLVRGREFNHAPCGSDVGPGGGDGQAAVSPTLPLRGATLISIHSCGERFGFNLRSPLRERRARQSATYATPFS